MKNKSPDSIIIDSYTNASQNYRPHGWENNYDTENDTMRGKKENELEQYLWSLLLEQGKMYGELLLSLWNTWISFNEEAQLGCIFTLMKYSS